MKTKGQVGYEEYCMHTGWKSLATGDHLPAWDMLPPQIQETWEVAAAAISRHIGDVVLTPRYIETSHVAIDLCKSCGEQPGYLLPVLEEGLMTSAVCPLCGAGPRYLFVDTHANTEQGAVVLWNMFNSQIKKVM